MKFSNIAFVVLGLFLLNSCGKIQPKGDIKTQSFPVKDFSQVQLEGKFRVFYVKADSNAVEVETYPNLIENLNIKSDQKKLTISEKSPVTGVDFYTITLYSKKDLQSVSLADSVEFNGSTEIKTHDFTLKLDQSSKFIGAVRTQKSTLEMSGHSLANIKGYTDKAYFKLKDTASIVAPFWELKTLEVQAKNGSYSEALVLDTLMGNLSNTASLLYYQNPVKKLKTEKSTKVVNKFAP